MFRLWSEELAYPFGLTHTGPDGGITPEYLQIKNSIRTLLKCRDAILKMVFQM